VPGTHYASDCGHNTLAGSVGPTGRAKAKALVARADERLRDDDDQALGIVGLCLRGLGSLSDE